MSMNFVDQLYAVFEVHGERNAFCIEGIFYTYKELLAKTKSIAASLNEKAPGERKIGILATNCLETYAGLLACLMTGRTYIPIHPNHPPERTRQIVEQSQLQTILCNKYDRQNAVVRLIVTENLDGSKIELSNSKYNSAADAYILFTSGSTGIPKGVPITYGNLDSFITAFGKLGYQVTCEDRFLQMFDLTFDLSVMSYLVPLCIGACVYTLPDEGMKFTNVYNILEEYNVTFALMVPSILASLKQYFHEIDLPALRYSLFCGEALYTETTIGWMKCAPNAIVENVYGPTEATIFCMTYPVTRDGLIEDYNGIISIGKSMAGMESQIADSDGHLLEGEVKGELCLAGDQLTMGYLNSDRNKTAFFEHNGTRYYRTGDIAFRTSNGNFMYAGRVDHQVKIQGYRIELSEIEFHLRQITNDSNLVALAIPNHAGQLEIQAVFEGQYIDVSGTLSELETKIPSYMMPTQVHFVKTFPLNTNGKTDRNELTKILNSTK